MFPVSRRSMVSNSSIIFLTITALLFESAICQYSNCSGDGQFEPRSEYDTNLYYLLANLTLKSVSETFYNFTTGENPNQVYGLFHCFYGIDNQLCQRSFQTAKNKLLQDCPSSIEAVVWHRKCLLRYANHPIVSINDVSRYHLVNTGPAEYGEYNQQRLKRIISAVDEATSGCSSLSSAARVSQVEENLHLQLEVECTRDLSKSDCRSCLQTAMNRYDKEGHKSALLLQPSCVIFSVFLVRTSPPSTATATPDKKIYISMGVTSGIAAIAIIVNIILISCIKRNKATRAPAGLGEIESMDNLQLELDAIKTATSNFSEDNKLGQGGFGIVYMGTLKDGQAVAVKRLSNTSRQGIREFKTEACLAAKLQHKNLAKVYGFCMEKEEMLLVYEFVPNKSLNRLLFDAEGVSLNWETRYKIIVGIARGLLYLHEHSSPKIIHRDLKPSNILLDSEMNPKIADFGMAKLFRGDQSQGNTSRIAGTFGYMAPEYVISGHISIKSDVFSYGVILLEIVSGLSIRCLDPDDQEDNLLVYTWKLWNEGNHLKLVDTTLGHNFSKYEVERCIQVGLLCTQEDPAIRPDIASVLIMLNSEVNTKMPLPSCPPDLPYKQETTAISQGSIGIPIEDIITELSPR